MRLNSSASRWTTCSVLCFLCVWLAQIQIVRSQVVAGYLPEYRFYINLNNTAQYLDDLIIFSMEVGDKGQLGPCCLGKDNFEKARQAREYKRENFPGSKPLRIWMSIGGAGRSNSFPNVSADPKLRKSFVKSLMEICHEESIDGIDFDWEAPQTPEEFQNYITLIKEAHDELKKAGILISIALHPKQYFPSFVYNDYISRVNLMACDMITKPGDHHADSRRMKEAIKGLKDSGCPKSKILIGIPAYGRHAKNPSEVKTFYEIVDGLLEEDPYHMGPNELSKTSSVKDFLYDSPERVKRKIDFAHLHGYAGVFLWELGQDKQHEEWAPGGILLQAAAGNWNYPRDEKEL